MKHDPTMRYLGVNSKALPAKLLGFRSEPRDIEAVEAALGRQVRKVNVHPDGNSADADAVRRKLREAARILRGSLSPATPPTTASPHVARARPETTTLRGPTPGWTPRGTSAQTSMQLTWFDQQVMAVLVGCGGWNITSRTKLVALAEAHGLSVQGLVKVITGLSEYAKSGGPRLGVAELTAGADRVPYLSPTPTSPLAIEERPESTTMAEPEQDAVWSRIKLPLLFGLVTLVVGIVAVRFALLPPARSSPKQADQVAESSGSVGAEPSRSDISKQQPSPRVEPRLARFDPAPTFSGDALPVVAVEAAAQCADLPGELDLLARRITVADQPSEAVYRNFNDIIQTVAAGWMFTDDSTREALGRAIFEVMYAAGDSPSVADRLLASLAPPTGPPADPIEIWRGAWMVSMLQRIAARSDLAPTMIQRARAQLDVAFEQAPIDLTDTRTTQSAWLDRTAGLLVDVMEFQAQIYDSWECWLAAQRFVGPGERYNAALMHAVEAIMASATDLSQAGPSVNVLGRLLSLANFQSSPVVRERVRSLFDDQQRIDVADLWVMTSLLAQSDNVYWFGDDLVLPYDADWIFRRRITDRIMDRWPEAASTIAALQNMPRGLPVDAALGSRWDTAMQRLLDRPLSSHPQQLLEELLMASWLNEAALRLVADELIVARGLIARVEQAIESRTVPTRPRGSPRTLRPGQPIGNDAVWAVAYEEAGRNPDERLRWLGRLRNHAGTDLGPIDAEQFVAVVYRGSPREVRDLAGLIVVEQFGTGPNVALQMLDQFAVAVSNNGLSETIGRLTGRLLPGQRSESWDVEARLALVEHALSLRPGGGSQLDLLSQLVTESYLNREAALRGQLRPALRSRSSQEAAQRLAEAWRDRATAAVAADPVPGDLPALARRGATRRRLADGPIQQFVAAQLAVLDLIAYITTAEQPHQATAGRELLSVAALRRTRLGHVFAQAADVERTIIAFWRMRISIEGGGDR